MFKKKNSYLTATHVATEEYYDHEDENKFIEKSSTNKYGNKECIENFEMRYIT